jgi:hypothetical protein
LKSFHILYRGLDIALYGGGLNEKSRARPCGRALPASVQRAFVDSLSPKASLATG